MYRGLPEKSPLHLEAVLEGYDPETIPSLGPTIDPHSGVPKGG